MFDLEKSQHAAALRLGDGRVSKSRRARCDRGHNRLHPQVLAFLQEALAGQSRPPMREIMAELAVSCEKSGLPCPSRATIYKRLVDIDVHDYAAEQLPAAVRSALYNLAEGALVPGRQLVFYCCNYGDLNAVSFAAGLPWLDLFQASRMRGWRAKSRGLLEAACRARYI